MKIRICAYVILLILAFSSCQKNTLSKIPSIDLTGFTNTPIKINKDNCFIDFNLTDGDGDLGNPVVAGGPYDIYIKDFRYDTGFAGYYFPPTNLTTDETKNGLTGSCTFVITPFIINARYDSLHANGDTTHFEIYIRDKAGNTSNHITTPNLVWIP